MLLDPLVPRVLNAIDSCDPKAAVDGYLEHSVQEADALILRDGAGRLASMTEFESSVNQDLLSLELWQLGLACRVHFDQDWN